MSYQFHKTDLTTHLYPEIIQLLPPQINICLTQTTINSATTTMAKGDTKIVMYICQPRSKVDNKYYPRTDSANQFHGYRLQLIRQDSPTTNINDDISVLHSWIIVYTKHWLATKLNILGRDVIVSTTQKSASKKPAFSTFKDAYDTSDRVVISNRRHGGTFQITLILIQFQIPKNPICVAFIFFVL